MVTAADNNGNGKINSQDYAAGQLPDPHDD